MKLIAISVATSSVGVGAMVYPYLIKVLTESIGVKGTLLILGGISLNAIPLAVLWSDPKYRSLSKYVEATTGVDTSQALIDKMKSDDNNIPNDKRNANDKHSENEKEAIAEVQNLLTEKCTSIEDDGGVGDHACINGFRNSDSKKMRRNDRNKKVCYRVTSRSDGIVAKFVETVTYTPFSVLICAYACSMPALITFEILYLDILETSGLSRDRGITLIIIMNGVCIPARIFPGLIHKIPRCCSSMGMIIGPLVFIMGMVLLTLVSGFAGL